MKTEEDEEINGSGFLTRWLRPLYGTKAIIKLFRARMKDRLPYIKMRRVGEVCRRSKLGVCATSSLPAKPRARAWIRASPPDPDLILKLLQCCNPNRLTHNWKVVKIEEPVETKAQAMILLNKESLSPLAESGGLIQYEFDKIKCLQG